MITGKPGYFVSIMIILILFLHNAGANDSLSIQSDMQIIAGRMLSPYRELPDMNSVNQFRSGLWMDGSWQDINYADSSTTAWKPVDTFEDC